MWRWGDGKEEFVNIASVYCILFLFYKVDLLIYILKNIMLGVSQTHWVRALLKIVLNSFPQLKTDAGWKWVT